MKYRQLSKEQFENLHEEFTKFLATQSIDKTEWKQYKHKNPKMVQEQLEIFSDIVWEDVLSKTQYLEHFSPNLINLFDCNEKKMQRIVIKTSKRDINFIKKEGYEWLLKNPSNDKVEIFKGTKSYANERNLEVFDLIEKGSTISKGELYKYFQKIIS